MRFFCLQVSQPRREGQKMKRLKTKILKWLPLEIPIYVVILRSQRTDRFLGLSLVDLHYKFAFIGHSLKCVFSCK